MELEFKAQVADPLHVQIQRQLEQSIRSGQLAEGERLPPTSELAKKWGVNYSAVQRAMDYLSAAGLVERKPRRGTFVRSAKDRAVIGLLVGPHLLEETAHFFRAMARAISEEIGGRQWRCLTYDQLTFANEQSMAESKQRLLHDIHHHRFKGLVLIGCSPATRQEFLRDNDLPTAIFGGPAGEVDVSSDVYDFGYAAARFLIQHGRKRIAYLRTVGPRTAKVRNDIDGLTDACKESGLSVAPHAIHQIDEIQHLRSYAPERFGYEQMLLMLTDWERAGQQPDGLIVSDDIVMRGAAQALAERGLRVPEQVEAITQANEGIDHLYPVPVARYVTPITQVAQDLVSILWKKIVGEPLPELPIVVRGRISTQSH